MTNANKKFKNYRLFLIKKSQKQDQKQLGIRFAHKAFLLATLGLGSNIESSLRSVNLL